MGSLSSRGELPAERLYRRGLPSRHGRGSRVMDRKLYRRSYADEPGLLERVYSLLDLAFPGLSAHARALGPLGLRWDQISTPFLVTNGDQPLAHVGVLEVPMVLDGRERLVGGIHAVCTHPNHRRRGYFRLTMDAALAWCDERYRTTLLIGGYSGLYEPLGFRLVRESRFVATVCRSGRTPHRQRLRRLDLDQPADLRILHRLLDERAPVSRRLGVVRERGVFLFTQAKQPMWYAEDLDTILCLEVADATLHLYDLVATRIPTLQEVVDRIDSRLKRVEVYFTPDQLEAQLAPEPHVVDRDSLLMARGEFLRPQDDVMLPGTARF